MEAISRFLAEERDYNISRNILGSETAVIERLQADSFEMQDAWQSLSEQCGDERQLFSVLRKIINLASFYNPESARNAREAIRNESEMRSEIALRAKELSELLQRYSRAPHNGFVISDIYASIGELFDHWSENSTSEDAYLYRTHLKEHMADLRCSYDAKYWPSLANCLSAMAEKAQKNTTLTGSQIELATQNRESSKTDYVRVIEWCLQENRVVLTNRHFASLINCSLGLMDDAVNIDWMKKTRQRIRARGDN